MFGLIPTLVVVANCQTEPDCQPQQVPVELVRLVHVGDHCPVVSSYFPSPSLLVARKNSPIPLPLQTEKNGMSSVLEEAALFGVSLEHPVDPKLVCEFTKGAKEDIL
jgi:hypothetical protein